MLKETILDKAQWEHQSSVYTGSIVAVTDDRPVQDSFTTWYAESNPIQKTVAYPARKAGGPDPGRLEVFMASGEVYRMESWATRWCGSFGIQASADGSRLYILSDIKGLCCCTPRGECLWQSMQTAVTRVIPHPDGSITALTFNGKALRMDREGKVLTTLRGIQAPQPMTRQVIAFLTGEYTLSFLDAFTLEKLQTLRLQPLGIEALHCVALSEQYIFLAGNRAAESRRLPDGKLRWITHPAMYLLRREDLHILREFDEDFIRGMILGVAPEVVTVIVPRARLTEDRLILFPSVPDGKTYRKLELQL